MCVQVGLWKLNINALSSKKMSFGNNDLFIHLYAAFKYDV
jgi:hypothetical protein